VIQLCILKGYGAQVGNSPDKIRIIRRKLSRLSGVHSYYPYDLLPEYHWHRQDGSDSFFAGLFGILDTIVFLSLIAFAFSLT